MFIGHFAVALATKRAVPRVSLGTLFAAVELPDLIWPVLVLAGVEKVRIVPGITAATPLDFQSYPFSHSLLFDLFWAAAFAGGYAVLRRAPRAVPWLAFAVLSHWVLDAASHRPDVPLLPGGPMVGLGLWYSRAATVFIEGALFAAGLFVYSRATVSRGLSGTIGLVALVALLLVIYGGAIFGPTPRSVDDIAWSGLGLWLLIGAACWVDSRRLARRGKILTESR